MYAAGACQMCLAGSASAAPVNLGHSSPTRALVRALLPEAHPALMHIYIQLDVCVYIYIYAHLYLSLSLYIYIYV